MSRITIKTSKSGAGLGTEVLIDDEKIPAITRLILDIPADGFATLTIEKNILNEQGKFYLVGEGDRQQIASEQLLFKGNADFDGEITRITTTQNDRP